MPEYESSRLLFNRPFDQHPALIVRCAGASDVARALDFVQNPQSTLGGAWRGQNRAGFSTCDGGVVIDLSAMNRVDVEADKRVARAQSGALARDMDLARALFYFSPLFSLRL
jgi:FAD/FMN-containing dehydrogenase